MMHFINSAADGELMAELRDAGVLAPDVIDRIDEAMGRPEAGTLNDFLLAGAELIPEKAWMSWLIRRHGCHRFGRVVWHGDATRWAHGGLPPDGNLPFRQCEDGGLLVAVLRPDCLEGTSRRLTAARLHWAAGSLAEMRRLSAAWRTIA